MNATDEKSAELQNYLAAKLACSLLRELTRRGIDSGIVADALVTVGLAAAIEARGVDCVLDHLRKVTGDIDHRRADFSVADGARLQ